ncbi:MAG: hypothetical protein LBF54_02115 [Holosporaceae bacterium]|nr:hypothetical protein [Holosporaceae bacterium]
MKDLQKGIAPPSKHPKKVSQPLWNKADSDLVLAIRRANPTYGKAKIAVKQILMQGGHRLDLR